MNHAGIGLIVTVAAFALVYPYLSSIVQSHSDSNIEDKIMSGQDWNNATSVYDFSALDVDGNNVSLRKYEGHVLIIVNVACKCGLTENNYKQLQELYERYGESQGLRIAAFPSNQFAGQEPGTNEEIKAEVQGKYGITFDLYSKINVNGDLAHPLWKYLKKSQSGVLVDWVKWNFTKFLIDKHGQPVKRYAPTTPPSEIEKELGEYFKQN